MLIALDVDYREDRVVTAAVGFHAWTDATPAFEHTRLSSSPPAEYEPGSFYKRELPYLLAILAEVAAPSTVIIDGFVTLGGDVKGLGAHLHDAIGVPVVGVAKRAWRGGSAGTAIVRGDGHAPQYVTAIGIAVADAVVHVASMHGPHRIPTLLKRVDRLARDSYAA